MLQKYFTIFIAMICTYLLQHHSIPFWQEQTDSINVGLMWSLTIEIVALWLWLNKKMFLAALASFIIVLVPLMQLSKPLLNEMRLIDANAHISKLNTVNLTQSKELQDRYIKKDWVVNLRKNNKHLRDDIQVQKQLLIKSSKLKSSYENIIILILQAAIIIVIFFTQILTFRKLAFQNIQKTEIAETSETQNFNISEIVETIEISETHNFRNSEILETAEIRAETLLSKIDSYKEHIGVTQSEMADKLDVSASDISKLRSKVKGTENALSDNKFSELEEKFEKLAS